MANNTNLYPISLSFQVIMAYWSNYHFWQGVHPFNSLVQQIWPQKTKRSLYRVVHSIFRYIKLFTHDHQCHKRTEIQTDAQTELW